MSYCVLIVFGLVLGFLSAIPVGAVQIEVVKRAVSGRMREAFLMALGSGTSDFLYGTVTLLGFGDLLFNRRNTMVIYMIGIVVMTVLLWQTIGDIRKERAGDDAGRLNTRRFPFAAGFVIAVTNPAIMAWWVVGFRIFFDMGLFSAPTFWIRLLFVIAGCSGLVGYLFLLAIALHRKRKSIPRHVIQLLNTVLAVLLGLLLVYFIVRLIQYIQV